VEATKAEKEAQEALEKAMSGSLARAMDFVKFAETKNGALLAFSSAWIVASVNMLGSASNLIAEYRPALMLALPFFFLASLICVAALLPRRLAGFHRPSDGAKSLLYFGDVATIDIGAVEQRFTERYRPPNGEAFTQAYLHDLTVQMAVNSRIAARKFALSTAAAICVAIALVILSIPAFCWVWRLLGSA
jgi:pycsar effector protein